GGILSFSLFAAPRLSPSGVLGDFALGNWADRMKSIGFAVQFDGGPTLPVKVDTSLLDSTLWSSLFPDSTPVTGWMLPPHAGRELKSYPAHTLHQFIQGLYSSVASTAASAVAFPSTETGPVADLINTVGRIPEVMCDVLNLNPQTATFLA